MASSAGRASIYGPGKPQGFSETLSAYLSQANNNGSAMAGFTGYAQPDAGRTDRRPPAIGRFRP